MNKYSILVYKNEGGDWEGEVNGDGNPILTVGYGFSNDPEGTRARASVLFEANAIIESKSRFEHVAESIEVQDHLAAFLRGYLRNANASPEVATALFIEDDFSDSRLRNVIAASVDARDTLGTTIAHAMVDYLDVRGRKKIVEEAIAIHSTHPVARAVEAR